MEYFNHADDPAWQDFYHKTDKGYHLDLQGYNAKICLDKGLSSGNIHLSSTNTATSPDYFSHSQGDKSGRFAVVAMIR